MLDTNDKKTENYTCDYLSDLSSSDCELLLGKTIKHVYGSDFGVVLTFTDGSDLKVSGHTYDGCSLDVEFNERVEL